VSAGTELSDADAHGHAVPGCHLRDTDANGDPMRSGYRPGLPDAHAVHRRELPNGDSVYGCELSNTDALRSGPLHADAHPLSAGRLRADTDSVYRSGLRHSNPTAVRSRSVYADADARGDCGSHHDSLT
jgi:hypothetical protein